MQLLIILILYLFLGIIRAYAKNENEIVFTTLKELSPTSFLSH